ncbi:hypothetical protein QFC22_000907 [Naganishia vaughanmartiniae]|uniref:Uncharacterized protein n=1 Tax=Naganishia vaughanmartiniae TaxID=1424756 RepID=A0ACC2XN32_9TREE|nr:hypothetical protein QFC22_000907 [Naganishia vaughanmartiniae]
MSKAPKSGPGIAPVLPAMGVHSYHNDSPPFSGATEYLAEPDLISLGAPQSNAQNGDNGHLSASSTSAHATPHFVVRGHTPPGASSSLEDYTNGSSENAADHEPSMTLAQMRLGHPATASQTSLQSQDSTLTARPTRPENPRVPTSQEDVSLSSMRSRRLLSGYIFGPPPVPDDTDHDHGKEITRNGLGSPAAKGNNLSLPHDVPQVPSTPSTVVSGYEEEIEAEQPSPSAEVDLLEGDDALMGFLDGEADADERARAVQAERGGSEGYMRKEPGEAGEYRFPIHRLKRKMKGKRMFEMAKDEIVESQTYEIMAGYYSPVSSYYKKAGLAPAHHRVRMCELAVEHTSTWLMVDPWEAGQPEYQRTAVVLDHFDEMLNGKDGESGVEMRNGSRRKYKVMLLAGGDLIESFGEPGVWSAPDLHIILGRFGCLIVERAGSDVWAFLLSHDILYHHRSSITIFRPPKFGESTGIPEKAGSYLVSQSNQSVRSTGYEHQILAAEQRDSVHPPEQIIPRTGQGGQ